jgi:hypothetical protein
LLVFALGGFGIAFVGTFFVVFFFMKDAWEGVDEYLQGNYPATVKEAHKEFGLEDTDGLFNPPEVFLFLEERLDSELRKDNAALVNILREKGKNDVRGALFLPGLLTEVRGDKGEDLTPLVDRFFIQAVFKFENIPMPDLNKQENESVN